MAQNKVGKRLWTLGGLKGAGDGASLSKSSLMKNAINYLKTNLTGAASNYKKAANSSDQSIATGNGLVQLPKSIRTIIKRGGSYFIVEGLGRGLIVGGDVVINPPNDTQFNNAIETIAGYIGAENLENKLNVISGKQTKLRKKLRTGEANLKTAKTGGYTSINSYAESN